MTTEDNYDESDAAGRSPVLREIRAESEKVFIGSGEDVCFSLSDTSPIWEYQ